MILPTIPAGKCNEFTRMALTRSNALVMVCFAAAWKLQSLAAGRLCGSMYCNCAVDFGRNTSDATRTSVHSSGLLLIFVSKLLSDLLSRTAPRWSIERLRTAACC